MPESPRGKKAEACDINVHANLVSLNGGIVLSICILLSALVGSAIMTNQLASTQAILFIVLAAAAWIYLIDSATEHLAYVGKKIIKTSAFSRRVAIPFEAIQSVLLKHEGPNDSLGIEAIIVVYRNGRSERLSLGPCWRRHELEAFLDTIDKAMGEDFGVEVQA